MVLVGVFLASSSSPRSLRSFSPFAASTVDPHPIMLNPRKRDVMADRKGPFEHLRVRNVVIAGMQACAFTAAPMLAAAQDEDELDMDKLRSEFVDFPCRALKMLCRVLSCTSLKRILEAVCVRLCSLKTAARLVKDPAKSAVRKALRGGRLLASAKMLRTAAYSNCLTYAANFIVEELLLLWHYKADLRRQTRGLLLGFGTAYACCTAGIASGTFVKPGWGTVLGAAFGDITGILILEQQHYNRDSS